MGDMYKTKNISQTLILITRPCIRKKNYHSVFEMSKPFVLAGEIWSTILLFSKTICRN